MSSDNLLHSWYRFRGNVPAIAGYWRSEYPDRLLAALARFKFPEVALFFEVEKMGVLSMLWFNRRTLRQDEWELLKEVFGSVQFNAFCTFQMLKGENCETCPIKNSGVLDPPEGMWYDIRFGRCVKNDLVKQILQLTERSVLGPQERFKQARFLIRERYLNKRKVSWDALVGLIQEEVMKTTKILEEKNEKGSKAKGSSSVKGTSGREKKTDSERPKVEARV